MSDFQAFKSSFKGDLLTPGDPGYEQAIARWAKNAARKAAVVAFTKDAEDVSKAVIYAKKNGLTIAIKGGGHNPGGASSSEGGLVIDLSRHMNGVTVDAEKKLGYVGGGALWETVDKVAIEYGLATVGGTVNHTGVGGLILGGGYGWLSGSYGLAVDNVVQATVVTADGAIRTANESENSDLFWGIRGAGSNFGVVTEFVLQLHPQRRKVFAGPAIFSPDQLDALTEVTQEWWTSGPSEKEGLLQIFTRGPNRHPCIICLLFYNGSEEEGRKVYKKFFDLKPIADMVKEIPYEELNSLQNHTTFHGQNAYLKGAFAPSPMPAGLLPKVFARVTALSEPPEHEIGLIQEYFPLAKANGVPDDATAYRRGLTANLLCLVFTKQEGEPGLAYARDAARELIGLFAERQDDANLGYGNYSPDSDALPGEGTTPVDKAKILFGPNYPKLQQIKKKYDPDLVFRKWFTITPAA